MLLILSNAWASLEEWNVRNNDKKFVFYHIYNLPIILGKGRDPT